MKDEEGDERERIRITHNKDVVSPTEGILEDGACPTRG